jgi:hypothetical protein
VLPELVTMVSRNMMYRCSKASPQKYSNKFGISFGLH